MKLNWNFLGEGGRGEKRKPSMGGGGGVWIFLELHIVLFNIHGMCNDH